MRQRRKAGGRDGTGRNQKARRAALGSFIGAVRSEDKAKARQERLNPPESSGSAKDRGLGDGPNGGSRSGARLADSKKVGRGSEGRTEDWRQSSSSSSTPSSAPNRSAAASSIFFPEAACSSRQASKASPASW